MCASLCSWGKFLPNEPSLTSTLKVQGVHYIISFMIKFTTQLKLSNNSRTMALEKLSVLPGLVSTCNCILYLHCTINILGVLHQMQHYFSWAEPLRWKRFTAIRSVTKIPHKPLLLSPFEAMGFKWADLSHCQLNVDISLPTTAASHFTDSANFTFKAEGEPSKSFYSFTRLFSQPLSSSPISQTNEASQRWLGQQPCRVCAPSARRCLFIRSIHIS